MSTAAAEERVAEKRPLPTEDNDAAADENGVAEKKAHLENGNEVRSL